MGSEGNPVERARRARTPLPPVLETRRGWGGAAFSGLDGAGCWASHLGGGERPPEPDWRASGPGVLPGPSGGGCYLEVARNLREGARGERSASL